MKLLNSRVYILLFSIFFVSSVLATPCKDLFSTSPENQVFKNMERANDNYVEFSFDSLGKAQTRAISVSNTPAVVKDPLSDPVLVSTEKKGSVYENSYIFDILKKYGHEAIYFFRDEHVGFKSIVAVHNTNLSEIKESQLGQRKWAVGGTRIWKYETEGEGLLDVLRLSEGMSYKASVANIPLGGGKAVIFGSPKEIKTEELLKVYGMYLRILDEQSQKSHTFMTGEDVGVSPEDVAIVAQTGKHRLIGLPDKSGDPSIRTAEGVIAGIQASVKWALNKESLKDLTVSVQGLGNVGSRVAQTLAKAGAKVNVYDIDAKKTRCLSQKFGLNMVSGKQILSGSCDVFVPCALGSVISAKTVKSFKCKVIAGSANNQLENPKYGDTLKEMGILYAPDYVINAGGLINVSREVFGMDQKEGDKWAEEKAKGIYNTLMHIFKIAEEKNISTAEAAELLAKQRIEEAQFIEKTIVTAVKSQ